MIFRSRSSAIFSRATNSDETTRAWLDDGADPTDVARPAVPVDFPFLPGVVDEFLDSAGEGLVLARRVSVVGNDAARTGKGFRFRATAFAVGRVATRVAECFRPIPSGEDAGNVEALDLDRETAPADFPDLPAAANKLVLGCRMGRPVVGNDAARTCEGFQFRRKSRASCRRRGYPSRPVLTRGGVAQVRNPLRT